MSRLGAPARLSCRTLATIWVVALAALFLHPAHAQQINIRTSTATNKCVDIPNNSQVSGSQLWQYTCNGTPAQLFTRTYVFNEYFTLRSTNGLCVTAGSPNTERPSSGMRLTLHPCNANYWSQQFRHEGWVITPRTSTRACVDIAGASGADAAAVQLWDCNGTPAQRFDIALINTAAPTPRPTAAPTPRPSAAPPASGWAAEMLRSINAERARVGAPALCFNSKLMSTAQSHSVYQAQIGSMQHAGPGGNTNAQRVTAAGYRWSAVAENVARGQSSVSDVMRSWMNSAGHRTNLLNSQYRHVGVGQAPGRNAPYWTQVFAASSSERCD